MASLKDRLAALNRQRVKIEIKSLDGEQTISAFYQRPTETEDTILRAAASDEYERMLRSYNEIPEGQLESVAQRVRVQLEAAGIEACCNVLLVPELESVRKEAKTRSGEPPAEDCDQSLKDLWQEEYKAHFDTELARRRKKYEGEGLEKIADRAADRRLSDMANERALQIYRRQLVVASLYEEEEESDGQKSGKFKKAFSDENEVAENLCSETIDAVANRCIEELTRAKNLPLKSASAN